MHDELTANDIKKMEDEIEYRKLVVRKKALDDVKVARAQGDLRRTSSTRPPSSLRTRMRAVSDTLRR